MPWAVSAATTPPAVPSLEATTASTLLSLAVRICSMFFCAFSGSQASVYCSPTTLMSPLVDRRLQHLLLSAAQEVGVRIRRRALDDHVVALGLDLEHLARLDAADLDIVEGQVEHAQALPASGHSR